LAGDAGPPGIAGEAGPPGSPGVSPFATNADGSIYYNGGSVGIGIANPSATLDVLSSIDNGNGWSLASQRTDGTAKTRIRGGGEIFFETGEGAKNDFSQVIPRMTISRDGNVGIGTIDPLVTLEINGQFHAHSISNSGDAYSLESRRGDNSAPTRIRSSSDGDIRFEVASDPFASPNLVTTLYIQRGQSVGVNTETPKATLDINGTARLAKYSSQPVACDQAHDGTIALNHLTKMCICDGTTWLSVKDDLACTW
jgi:hypothetical protein